MRNQILLQYSKMFVDISVTPLPQLRGALPRQLNPENEDVDGESVTTSVLISRDGERCGVVTVTARVKKQRELHIVLWEWSSFFHFQSNQFCCT